MLNAIRKRPRISSVYLNCNFVLKSRSKDYTTNTRDPEQQEQSPPHVSSEKKEFRRVTEDVKNAGQRQDIVEIEKQSGERDEKHR
jgi:hypothetical protein